MKNLRASKNKQEILAFLMEAIIKEIPITLWQTSNEQRYVTQGLISDVESGKVKVKFTEPSDQEFILNRKLEVYGHSKYRSVLFKQSIVSLNSDEMIINTPTEIRLHELRKNTRYYYRETDKKEISYLNPLLKLTKSEIVSSPLFDVSRGGASFLITLDKMPNFHSKDKLSIKSITDQKIPNDLEARIIHIKLHQKATMSSPELYLVGIKFNCELNKIDYLL